MLVHRLFDCFSPKFQCSCRSLNVESMPFANNANNRNTKRIFFYRFLDKTSFSDDLPISVDQTQFTDGIVS